VPFTMARQQEAYAQVMTCFRQHWAENSSNTEELLCSYLVATNKPTEDT
jgi:hypothetical protein